jgi:hypothetical protein
MLNDTFNFYSSHSHMLALWRHESI